MARKPKAKGGSERKGKVSARPTSADFRVELDKPNPSPLDFINRRMAKLDGEGEG
jgi:hypothetical protein